MKTIQNLIKDENFKKTIANVLKVLIVIILLTGIIFAVSKHDSASSSNSYIENIVYKKQDTNKNLQVVFDINGKAVDEKVSVVHNKKRCNVNLQKDLYYFIAKENGSYTIKYGKFEKEIKITNIDKDTPSLDSINKDSNLLTFTLTDKGSGIDYEKSYVKMGDKEIKMIDSGEGIGVPNESITENSKLYLYDKAGNCSTFDITVS
ncbi:MAG: hypothetical protein PHH04_06995 [Thomasclavelia sp.]|nr:hypothetical protein [Thomasclavelia sp.]